MAKAIETGMPKLRIEESAARKQARIDRGEDVIVGVNKYRLETRTRGRAWRSTTDAVRESQVRRLADIRARDEKAVQSIAGSDLPGAQRLRATCWNWPSSPPALRATVGEISFAMEREFGRFNARPRPYPVSTARRLQHDEDWQAHRSRHRGLPGKARPPPAHAGVQDGPGRP
jgi:methylmalonyl-CoA mutase